MKSSSIPLCDAAIGTEYIIDHVENCDAYKINLQGYGIIPGGKIKLIFKSPTNDPCAYEVMGAVLAMRREDSNQIYVIASS